MPPTPSMRQDRDGEHDDAHAAEPAQQVAPQIDRARQVLEAGEHRAAGGGEPGRRLEIGSGEIDRQVVPAAAMPATAGSATQVSATSIKPSRVFSSRLKRRVASHSSAPSTKVANAEITNDHSAGSNCPDGHDQRREHGHREHHHDHGEHVRDRQQSVLHRNDAEPWKSFSTASMCRRSVRNRIK